MVDSTLAAQANLTAAGCEQPIAEIAADKGYHSAANMELSDSPDLRTYIPERKSKRKCKCQQPCRCQTKSQRSSQKARRSTRCSALTYRDASTNPHLAKMVKKAEIGKGYPQACHPF